MKLLEKMDERTHKLGWVDVKLAGGSAYFIGLLLAALFPALVTVHPAWYAAGAVLCGSVPAWAFCFRK